MTTQTITQTTHEITTHCGFPASWYLVNIDKEVDDMHCVTLYDITIGVLDFLNAQTETANEFTVVRQTIAEDYSTATVVIEGEYYARAEGGGRDVSRTNLMRAIIEASAKH